MPWQELSKMSCRMNFVLRYEGGETISDLCHEYGISRKTGYKFLERYKKLGPSGLGDRSHRPHRLANSTAQPTQDLILEAKQSHPTWGAAKIREFLKRRNPGVRFPARSTVHDILYKNGLVKKRRVRQRSTHLIANPIVESVRENDVWCADYKGQFKLQNGNYCYPLTISDHFSRYLIECEGLENTRGDGAIDVFERAFKEYGLPNGILTDNGAPFGSQSLFGLSRLNIWWLRLGIKIFRIEPGCPEQNGRHERMHRTLAQDTTRPAGINILQQQERFEKFKRVYNFDRPHEALEMKTPSEMYKPSIRSYPKRLPEPVYPFHDFVLSADSAGHINFRNLEFFISQIFTGQIFGLREEEEKLWRVSFLNYDIGFCDGEDGLFYPCESLKLS